MLKAITIVGCASFLLGVKYGVRYTKKSYVKTDELNALAIDFLEWLQIGLGDDVTIEEFNKIYSEKLAFLNLVASQ